MPIGNNEAKVRVKLDTGTAKAELASLTKGAASVAGNIGSGIRNAVRTGLGAAGLGGAFGVGLGAAQSALGGPTLGAIGDVASEFVGPWGALARNWLFDGLDVNARASKQAREQTIQAFGSVIGMTGQIPKGAYSYFDQVQRLHLSAEKGRQAIEGDDRFYAMSEERKQAVNKLVDAMVWLADKVSMVQFGGWSPFSKGR